MPDPKSVDVKITVGVDCPIKSACPHANQSVKSMTDNLTGTTWVPKKRIEELEAECDAAKRRVKNIEMSYVKMMSERDALKVRIDAAIGYADLTYITSYARELRATLTGNTTPATDPEKARADALQERIAELEAERDELQARIVAAIAWAGKQTRGARTYIGMRNILEGLPVETNMPPEPATTDPEKARADEFQNRIDKAVKYARDIFACDDPSYKGAIHRVIAIITADA